MAAENSTWGQEHIANELKLKLGIWVSPPTVGKYLREWPRARFRIVYVFALLELGRRRILYCNVTDHPSEEWTLQQLQEALPMIIRSAFSSMTGTASSLWNETKRLPP
jgi:hypothetical protein